MLEELNQAIGRMHSVENENSFNRDQICVNLPLLLKQSIKILDEIMSCKFSHLKRIKIEELAEMLVDFSFVSIRSSSGRRLKRRIWLFYIYSVNRGAVYGEIYDRYLAAKVKIQTVLHVSYAEECQTTDGKSQKYEYALSKRLVPTWLDAYTDSVLEEIITAYFFVWISAQDWYQENIILDKGA